MSDMQITHSSFINFATNLTEVHMKKTLGSFAALATAFVGQHADAKMNKQVQTNESRPTTIPAVSQQNQMENLRVVANGKKFDFVLKNSGTTGELFAYHRSHSSHASHRSHSSSRY